MAARARVKAAWRSRKDLGDNVFQDTQQKNKSAFQFFSNDQRSESVIGVETADDAGNVEKINLNVHQAPPVSDPAEIQEWVRIRLRKVIVYWVAMVVLCCVLNAFVLYTFRILPNIYAERELWRTFLAPPAKITSIVIVNVVILAICFYALYILVYPDESTWRLGRGRWLVVFLLITYLCICLGMHLWDSTFMLLNLKSVMINDMKNKKNHLLESQSQSYFQCCGIDSPQDWRRIAKLDIENVGFPLSCCNRKNNPLCGQPLLESFRPDPFEDSEDEDSEDDQKVVYAIWREGCYINEILVTGVLTGVFTLLSAAFIFTSIPTLVYTRYILNHVDMQYINVDRANPFYD